MRMTIYVADALKARMSEVCEAEDVNWSALACRAFEAKLAEIASRKQEKDMRDVIDRLRASAQQAEGEDHERGFAAGQEWAKSQATAAQLRRLAKAREPGTDWYFTDESLSPPADVLFINIILDNLDNRDAQDFWSDEVGEDVTITPCFVQGFAEGAMAVWERVVDEL